MPDGQPLPLQFNPQVVKDATRRGGGTNYYDCDKVRFVNGYPRSIGGWQKISNEAVLGVPRALFGWSDLSGSNIMAVGTSWKYYLEEGGSYTDITPVRASSTINSNPFATTNGSSVVTVTDTAHGASENDFVTFSGATAFANLTTDDLNDEFQIASIIDADTYTIDVGVVANATTSGGGASVVAEYQITTGLDTTLLGGGWGAGSWGRGGWGSGVSTVVLSAQLRVWTQDNFGEDLVFAPRSGELYYKDISAGGGRAVAITSLPGANEVPVICDQVLVSADERTLFAFGCNPIGSSTADPLMVRWADRESLVEWEPTDTTSAGGFRLSLGSKHMIACKIRQGIAEFTNKALYVIQFLGESGYAPRLISDNTIILGPKAAATLNGVLYWMNTRGIGSYNGTVQDLPSPLVQYIYDRMNTTQAWKCHIGVNTEFGELKFFYCSSNSDEIDSYVIYNVNDQSWTPGTLDRTAWLEPGTFQKPRASDPDGYIYEHESGLNDGSTNPPDPLNSYIESCLFPLIGNGKYAARIRWINPDINFNGSTAASPQITVSLRLQKRVGSPTALAEAGDVVRTVSVPVEEFTDQIDLNKRAHYVSFRIDCTATDVAWQMGIPELDIIQDGQR